MNTTNTENNNGVTVMSPTHPQWDKFFIALNRYVKRNGCDSVSLKGAAFILADQNYKWGEVDLDESLKFFRDHGGFCDCEVLLNVESCFEDAVF